MKLIQRIILVVAVIPVFGWGFFAHQKINRLAVFALPIEMIGFYKANIQYLTDAAVNADRRRYAVADEAPKHYIDLDDYGDSAVYKLPRYWKEAVAKYGEDTLTARGIVPWHIYRIYFQLKDAMMIKDTDRILRLSADMGHYIADAHVPLHTTKNYDGQLTDQIGLHAFWESRLPELFFTDYDFYVGKATYLNNVQLAAWDAITKANTALDSVLILEKNLAMKMGDRKFNFETKGKQTAKVVSASYSDQYHKLLNGMVERQMRASIKMIGDVWYTAWIDAGQPDLKELINYKPTEYELKKRMEELKKWYEEKLILPRNHEADN